MTSCKTTLFTNLDSVTIRGVRTWCRALMLSDDPEFDDHTTRRYRLAGFGSTCLWFVFDMTLASGDYEFAVADSRHHAVMMDDEGVARPIATGGLLTVHASGTTPEQLTLIAFNIGIGIDTIEGTFEPEGWADYCDRIKTAVFESSMAAVETYPVPINARGAISGPPAMLRDILSKFAR
jgi:hypothetical protein